MPQCATVSGQTIQDALFEALAASPLGESPDLDMLQWWLEIQPGGATIGVSVDVGLERVTWWSSGPQEHQLPTVRHYLTEGGADPEVLEHFEWSLENLQATLVGSWVELTADRVGGGWFTPDSVASNIAVQIAAPSPPRDALAAWIETTGREFCAGIVRSAFGSQRLTELVLPLVEGSVAERAHAARGAFAALGIPEPPYDVIDALSAEDAQALAIHACLSPAGLTRAGVVVPGGDTRLMLALAGRSERFDAAALADFEDALRAGRSMVLADTTDEGLQVEVYYTY